MFIALAVFLAASSVACGEPAPESTRQSRSDTVDTAAEPIAPARYLTNFMFAGADRTAFFGKFDQTTNQRALLRTYDAWWAGSDGWTELLRLRDTLPVPRAAWRVLPATAMQVQVGDAREVVALTFPAPSGRVELRANADASVWTGPTGQRESIGFATLVAGGEAASGILFFRRAARALQFPGDPGEGRGFVMADSAGNGLLIETDRSDEPAVARTWFDGAVASWDSVTFVADSVSADETARSWRFEIPGAALSGTIRAIPEAGVPAFRIEGDLLADGELLRFTGLAAPLPLP